MYKTFVIPYEIGELAEELELDLISTGGGVDYVGLSLPIPCSDPVQALISDPAGFCPPKLKSPADLYFYPDPDWQPEEGLTIRFTTTKAAMKALAKMRWVRRSDYHRHGEVTFPKFEKRGEE